jgi:hypothetical protein
VRRREVVVLEKESLEFGEVAVASVECSSPFINNPTIMYTCLFF